MDEALLVTLVLQHPRRVGTRQSERQTKKLSESRHGQAPPAEARFGSQCSGHRPSHVTQAGREC